MRPISDNRGDNNRSPDTVMSRNPYQIVEGYRCSMCSEDAEMPTSIDRGDNS